MLDDDAGGAFGAEFAHAGPGRIRVEVVVVAQLFFALNLHGVCQGEGVAARIGIRGAQLVEGRPLMRVLAVAQVGGLFQHDQLVLGEGLGGVCRVCHVRACTAFFTRRIRELPGQPAGDGSIVGARLLEHRKGKALARGQRRCTIVRAHLVQHRVVVGRVCDHRDEGVVFRRATQHGRPADVDVLDRVGVIHVRLGHRLLEGVEVHHHHVDGLNAVGVRVVHVTLVVAARKQAAVHLRVQGLHPPVHDLGKTGEVLDGDDGHARLHQRLRRAARADDLDAKLVGQRATKLRDARLVRDRHNRAPYLLLCHVRRLLCQNLPAMPFGRRARRCR